MAKNTQRNNSSAAAERRREQNRIAQRNHRNKVRERQAEDNNSNEGSWDPSEQRQTTPRTLSMSEMFFEMPKDASQPQYPLDQNALSKNMFAMDPSLHMNFSIPQATCACNSTWGPCQFHRQQLRAELSPNSQIEQSFIHAGLDMAGASDISLSGSLTSCPSLPNLPPEVMNMQTNLTAHPPPQTLQPDGQTLTPAPAPSVMNESKDEITQKFCKLLENAQECGFSTFDEVVALYYTHNFDKQSVPDAAQKISRGTRLWKVLADINENASSWTLWEVRGYRQKIVEAAESVYSREMARITQGSTDGNAIVLGTERFPEPPSIDSISQIYACTDGGNQRLRNLQHELSGFQDICQNKLPNLWALLFGLTGHQEANCEIAATAAISMLYWAAKIPEPNTIDSAVILDMKNRLQDATMKDNASECDSGYRSGSSVSGATSGGPGAMHRRKTTETF